jgi:hypothetical protein
VACECLVCAIQEFLKQRKGEPILVQLDAKQAYIGPRIEFGHACIRLFVKSTLGLVKPTAEDVTYLTQKYGEHTLWCTDEDGDVPIESADAARTRLLGV